MTVASVLQHAGHRVGLYSSPHLCSFRERIRMNGVPITEAELLETARPLWPAIDASGASFFEATTVLAFAAFARAGVDVAVIEVGLGGRLDATNVDPAVSVITNIAFDHAEYLGDTIDAIAREKAGIIKPGRPVVTGETHGSAYDVFAASAAERGAPIDVVQLPADVRFALDGTRFRVRGGHFDGLLVHTPLIGEHQARNTAIAVRALEHFGITDAAVVREGIRSRAVAGATAGRVDDRMHVDLRRCAQRCRRRSPGSILRAARFAASDRSAHRHPRRQGLAAHAATTFRPGR